MREREPRPDRPGELEDCRQPLPEQIHLARAGQAEGRGGGADPDLLTRDGNVLRRREEQGERDRSGGDEEASAQVGEDQPGTASQRPHARLGPAGGPVQATGRGLVASLQPFLVT